MDRYKFRGNRIDNGEWVYGYYCKTLEDHFIMPKTEEVEKHDGYSYIVDASTVGQYTGLKDKNGVEIYEGDVLYHAMQGKRKVYYPFSDDVGAYGIENVENGFKNTLDDTFLYEVIGNIHDNKELLEGNQ